MAACGSADTAPSVPSSRQPAPARPDPDRDPDQTGRTLDAYDTISDDDQPQTGVRRHRPTGHRPDDTVWVNTVNHFGPIANRGGPGLVEQRNVLRPVTICVSNRSTCRFQPTLTIGPSQHSKASHADPQLAVPPWPAATIVVVGWPPVQLSTIVASVWWSITTCMSRSKTARSRAASGASTAS